MKIWPSLKRSKISKIRGAMPTKLSEANKKGEKISETEEALPTKIGFHVFHVNLNFLSQFYFWPPWTIVHGPKWNFGCFEGKWKRGISPKLERPHLPKLVSMHFTSTSTCMNFLSGFYFLTPMSPWSKGKFQPFWGKWKKGKISETENALTTKIGFHAFRHFHVNLYLHEFLKQILFFDPHGL